MISDWFVCAFSDVLRLSFYSLLDTQVNFCAAWEGCSTRVGRGLPTCFGVGETTSVPSRSQRGVVGTLETCWGDFDSNFNDILCWEQRLQGMYHC